MDNYDRIHENRHVFYADFEGQRYRFYPAEHVNIGRGWMLIEIDRQIGRVISEKEITNIQFTDYTFQDVINDRSARGEPPV